MCWKWLLRKARCDRRSRSCSSGSERRDPQRAPFSFSAGRPLRPRSTKRSRVNYAFVLLVASSATGSSVLSLFACGLFGSSGCFVGAPVVVRSFALLGLLLRASFSSASGFGWCVVRGVVIVDVGPLVVDCVCGACGFLSFVFVMIVGSLVLHSKGDIADRGPIFRSHHIRTRHSSIPAAFSASGPHLSSGPCELPWANPTPIAAHSVAGSTRIRVLQRSSSNARKHLASTPEECSFPSLQQQHGMKLDRCTIPTLSPDTDRRPNRPGEAERGPPE